MRLQKGVDQERREMGVVPWAELFTAVAGANRGSVKI